MTAARLLDLALPRVRALARGPGTALVAVDGADGAGKSTLAAALVRRLRADGAVAVGVSVDGFHAPRARRYARGRFSPEGFFLDSYDHDAVRAELLDPWRAGRGTYRTAVHDVATDAVLEVPAEERFRRMALRDGCPADPDHPDNARYLRGQRLYERTCDPAGRADLVLPRTP